MTDDRNAKVLEKIVADNAVIGANLWIDVWLQRNKPEEGRSKIAKALNDALCNDEFLKLRATWAEANIALHNSTAYNPVKESNAAFHAEIAVKNFFWDKYTLNDQELNQAMSLLDQYEEHELSFLKALPEPAIADMSPQELFNLARTRLDYCKKPTGGTSINLLF